MPYAVTMVAETDEELMLRYGAGDAAAFEVLYGRHKGPLYRHLLRQCSSRSVAEELFQDVWMKLIQARERYTVQARFTTYLYTLAHHRLIDHYRRQGRMPGSYGDDPPPEEIPANHGTNPQRQAHTGQLTERFLQLLGELPEAQREAWLLREESGLALKEIATATGVAPETAKSGLRYATKRLRRGMGLKS